MSRRILCIEDDPGLQELLQLVFERTDYELRWCASGREGLEQFAQQRPDLVLLDLLLPDVSGLEVCRQIRARSSVPIIILSVRAQPTDILSGQAVGADFYFTKPFLLQELLDSVEACLRPQRAGRRGR